MTNLVGNALKFTSEGKVEFGYTLKGDIIEFYVSDTGIGIPQQHHEMIFKRFFQADSSNTRRYEGTKLLNKLGVPFMPSYLVPNA